ncbi:MAG: CotH kinase family protein [Lachnospiraceae bacterium]|nr:CotH kinase family protein [Lachnospiraceae bacterium]
MRKKILAALLVVLSVVLLAVGLTACNSEKEYKNPAVNLPNETDFSGNNDNLPDEKNPAENGDKLPDEKNPSESGDDPFPDEELLLSLKEERGIEFLELPVMVIDTRNSAPISDKENYVTCSVSVMNAEKKYCFAYRSAGIRGRGNSTWSMPKKPYKLKFDSKVDLFGNGAAKKWTLIANYCDPSLIRNYLAYTIGSELDGISATTTKIQCVELFLNGQYDGVYLICEQNETGKTRVNIEDDFMKADKPEDMGYLLEMDNRGYNENNLGVADKDYFLVNGNAYVVKSPDYEDLKSDQSFTAYVKYIKRYVGSAWEAVLSGDYDTIKEYINVESFVDAYILNELFNTCDVGWTSFWMYKQENGKLFCGPVWDFDISSGNCNYNNSCDSNVLWAKNNNSWFTKLLECKEFYKSVSERLKANRETIKTIINDSVNDLLNNYRGSFERNFERWDTLGEYIWPNTEEIVAITSWEEQVEYVREWLLNSLNYIVSVYRR